VSRKILRGFEPGRFATIRRGRDISIPDLVRLINAAHGGIRLTKFAAYAWERGDRVPSVENLAAAAAVLKVGLDELIVVPEPERTLADLRWLAGLTQPALAQRLGIRAQAYSEVERGETALPDELAAQLADALGVEVAAVRRAWDNARTRPEGAPA
jgi:transcriptional regulator with XRE-family HTH domain